MSRFITDMPELELDSDHGNYSGKSLILVVEDDPGVSELLGSILEHFGFEHALANSAENALRVIDGGMKADLIVLDWMLPGINGVEFITNLRERDYDCPIVMMSALAQEEDIKSALRAGIDHYAVKPLQIGRLMEKIKSLLKNNKKVAKRADTLSEHQLINFKALSEIQVIDVSKNGCGIETTFPVPVDSVAFLFIENLAQKIELPVDYLFPARVCNCRMRGKRFRMGCQFLGLPWDVSEEIDKICRAAKSSVPIENLPKKNMRKCTLISEKEIALPSVLVVDDDRDICDMLKRQLELNKFSVFTAVNSEDALSLINSNPQITIVILDLMLQDTDIDGLALMRKILKINPNTDVMVLSAKDQQKDILASLEYGASDYFIKPMKHNDLIFKLKNLLHMGDFEERKRENPRRSMPLVGHIKLGITKVTEKGLCLASTFRVANGSLIFLHSQQLNEELDIERQKRFSLKVIKCAGTGGADNSFSICGSFHSLHPGIIDSIRRVFPE